ncbi:Aspercryptin biosynthesis cluster-specific transcription regulator atnN-like protein [Elsinoe fawcettii]|nr:Aspercryptin biosynthesis cluster-specific transcription regulator atnN-like protein [Elsinoe fawcettii]
MSTAGDGATCKRRVKGRTKVKTGCGTCRIRKIKCDEDKPFCKKCVSTGRSCDGYTSQIRFYSVSSAAKTKKGDAKLTVRRQPEDARVESRTTSDEIDRLSRYLSIKTVFDARSDCHEEAERILEASLTDATVRHAVSALKALRTNLEASGINPATGVKQTPEYDFGLQEYGLALEGVVSRLLDLSIDDLISALLCCHIFISIEQVQMSYSSMVQHMIRGLRIMHDYHARPSITEDSVFIPACDRLPHLDVFIIKLFAAPSKFEEPKTTTRNDQALSHAYEGASEETPVPTYGRRKIVPDRRAGLVKIATSTLDFLSRLTRIEDAGNVPNLLLERKVLLASLASWLAGLESNQSIHEQGGEPVHTTFTLILHSTLKIVMLGALNTSSTIEAELQAENERMQRLGDNATELLKDYKTTARSKG